MKLDFETIFDLYTHKNTKVLCQIKVNPEGDNFKISSRCLSQDHWKAFDNELEKFITRIDEWDNEKCLKFIIKPFIEVKVKKSDLTFEHFYKCFCAIGECDIGDVADVMCTKFVLECLVDFKVDVPFESTESQGNSETPLQGICSPLSYTEQTPSRKKKTYDMDAVKFPNIEFLNDNNAFSPKPIVIEPLLSETKTICNISPIISTDSSNISNKSMDSSRLIEVETEYEIGLEVRNINSSRDSRKIKNENEGTCRKEGTSNVFAENTNENNKRKKEIHNDCSSKIIKTRAYNVDKIPSARSVDFVKPQRKKEEINSKSYKKLHKRDKISFHKLKNRKDEKVSTSKVKPTSSTEKISKRFLSEYAITKSTPKKLEIDSNLPTIRSDVEFEDDKEPKRNVDSENINVKAAFSSATESITDLSSPEESQLDRKPSRTKFTRSLLRRSERSPTKPKRFTEEQNELLNLKKSKYKSSLSDKNKKLFGTDDEGVQYSENNNGQNIRDNEIKTSLFDTPTNKNSVYRNSSSSSSTKKKRYRDKSNSECDQEKRDMSKWLSKKKITSLDKDEAKSSKAQKKYSSPRALLLKTSPKVKFHRADVNIEHCSTPSTPTSISLELPSREELELMRNKTKLIQTENAKLKAELDKMCSSPPKEVEILSLQNIPVEEILDSFAAYKSDLDEIYENNRKKDYIKGHDGINHCLIIRLLQQNIQMKMLEKLTEVYSNSKTTTQATLFANALLPEWVLRVYMEKFNFSRQQAIDQIKAQEEFQLHLEDQGDSSFMFD